MPSQAQAYAEQTQKVLALRQNEALLRRQRDRDVDEHLEKIVQAREALEKSLKAFQETIVLAQRSVRLASSEESSHYKVYLTMQLRMSGAINQALLRTKAMDRNLASVKADRLERERFETQQQERQQQLLARKEIQRDIQQTLLPQADDFELLYGEDSEEVNSASR